MNFLTPRVWNDVCQDDGDKAWRCRKARECDALPELIRNGKVFTCSLANRYNPLVCCPPPTSNHVNQTISQQKCQEYKEALCHQTSEPNQRLAGGLPDTLLESTSPVSNDTEDWLTEVGEEVLDQGTTAITPNVSVYGGEAASAGEHPHMREGSVGIAGSDRHQRQGRPYAATVPDSRTLRAQRLPQFSDVQRHRTVPTGQGRSVHEVRGACVSLSGTG
ncbi:hypothetical protein J6590_007592 [Homalodisca vitripennis]|nr:hypothetical protein J6590_007592 [Homalodisca vitripennis]